MSIFRVVAASWRRAPGELFLSTTVIAIGIWLCLAAMSAQRGITNWIPRYGAHGRLVTLRGAANGEPFSQQFDPARLDRLRKEWSQVAAVAGYSERDATLTDAGQLKSIAVASVLGDLTEVLGVAVRDGRSCGWESNDGEVVLTHDVAQRLGAGVGTPVVLDGRARIVIGILAEGPGFPSQSTSLWVCSRRVPTTDRTADIVRVSVSRYWVLAQLQPTAGIESAQRQAVALLGAQDLVVQEVGGAARQALEPLARASSVLAIMILLASTGAVALMAIAKATGSAGVWRTHLALGASPAQLLRLVLFDASIPAAFGAIIATVGFSSTAPLLVAAVRGVAQIELSVDLWDSALTALALAAMISIVSALIPLRLARRTAHRSVTRTVGQTMTRRRVGLMLSAQAAIAAGFFAIAGGLGSAVVHVWTVNRGFELEDRAAARVDLSADASGRSRVELLWSVLDAVDRPPYVEAAAIDRMPLPSKGTAFDLAFRRADPSGVSYDSGQPTAVALVTPMFFDVIGARFMSGRACSTQEADASVHVVVINDALARRGGTSTATQVRVFGKLLPVIGVVVDLREGGLADTPEPTAYFCLGRLGPPSVVRAGGMKKVEIVVRSRETAVDSAQWLRERLMPFLRSVSLEDVSSLRSRLARSVGPLNLLATTFVALAALSAFVLVAASVALARITLIRQRREIGVRLAIGATRWQLTRSLSGPSTVWAAIGAVAGAAIGGTAFHLLRSQVPGLGAIPSAAVALTTISALVLSSLSGFLLTWRMARSPISHLLDG